MKIKIRYKSLFRRTIEAIKTVYRKNYTYKGIKFTGRPNSRISRRLREQLKNQAV